MTSQLSACEPLVLVWHQRSFRAVVWWRATAQFSEFNLHSLTTTCQRTSEKQRGGQGERRGMWRDSEKNSRRLKQTDRQTEERHEGKFPPVIERRDWQSKCGTKATLCRRRLRIIHRLRSHWKGERGNKRRDERSEREVNSRVAERKWQEEKKKKKRSGRTGMSSARLNILSQCEEINWPNRAMRQSSIPVNKSWGQRRGLQMLQHKIKNMHTKAH